MATLMTGNANTMTIPQLDNVIKLLKEKLETKEVKQNSTLTSKLENLLYDYTKAKNKILRYFEKTKSRHPELVVGKKNTLTIVKILENEGKTKKANKAAQKEQKWAYNVTDFLKDTKGFAVGIAATAGALGVANVISNAVAQKGILEVIGKAIAKAFSTQPLSAGLITAGLAIGGACILVPKIARTIERIKNNKTKSREYNNEILNSTSEDSLDTSKSVDEIKNVLLSNKDLREKLTDKDFLKSAGFTDYEKSKIMAAEASLAKEQKEETNKNLYTAAEQKYISDNYDTFLENYEFIVTYYPGVKDKDLATLEQELKDMTQQQSTTEAQKELVDAKNKENDAKAAELNAKAALDTADNDLKTATATYNSAEITKNQANNKYQKLIEDRDNKTRKVTQKELDDALNESSKADTVFKQAEIKVNEANENVRIADEALKTAEKNVKEAGEAVAAAKEKVDKIEKHNKNNVYDIYALKALRDKAEKNNTAAYAAYLDDPTNTNLKDAADKAQDAFEKAEADYNNADNLIKKKESEINKRKDYEKAIKDLSSIGIAPDKIEEELKKKNRVAQLDL